MLLPEDPSLAFWDKELTKADLDGALQFAAAAAHSSADSFVKPKRSSLREYSDSWRNCVPG